MGDMADYARDNGPNHAHPDSPMGQRRGQVLREGEEEPEARMSPTWEDLAREPGYQKLLNEVAGATENLTSEDMDEWEREVDRLRKEGKI